MKKIASLTVLSLSIVTASYAQDAKMNTTPAYDNIKSEQSFDHRMPKDMEKYSLMDNSDRIPTGFIQPVNRVTLVGNQPDGFLYKIQPADNSPSRYDIRKATFPKTNRLPIN